MKVGDKVKVLGIFGVDQIDKHYVGLEGIIDRIVTSSNYPYRVKFDSYQNNQFREDELQLINKEENMNKDLEQIIKEGDMAMKLVGSVKASPTTIAYTEDITSTLGTLKKKDKRVGFVSTPLKNTI